MNAPPVQYTRTKDGYSIAFTIHGEGPLLVFLPFVFSHAQAVWAASSATPLLQALARRFRVLYYDGRGTGLSPRGLPPETSIASLALDLRAVLDMAGPEKQVLLADNCMAHLAAQFVIENPGRVRALGLMHCPVSLVNQVKWVSSLAGQNWEYFLNVNSGLAAPSDAAEISRFSTRVEGLKARITQEDFLRLCDVFSASDISETLPRVGVPTLVLHIPTRGWVTQEESAATASLLPNGRLAVVSGATFFGEPNEITATIEGFLAESATEAPRVSPSSTLSMREIEVLKLVAAGKSNQQIADELVISLNTVNRHVSNVYAKTGAANRAEAVSYAHRHGLAN